MLFLAQLPFQMWRHLLALRNEPFFCANTADDTQPIHQLQNSQEVHTSKKKVHPLAKHLRSTWKRIETYEKLPVKQQIQLREARCWNVSVLYGHCPNSLAPPPLCQTGKRGKKCPKPSWQDFTPPSPYGHCPYGNNTFQKGASLRWLFDPVLHSSLDDLVMMFRQII